MTTFVTDDCIATRGHARAIAAILRKLGYEARIEHTGRRSREWRVWVKHPTMGGVIAYVHRDDQLDNTFNPHWI